ncbi:MAG: hypothetical protein V4474_03305 [Patescibacteria group bacterium]
MKTRIAKIGITAALIAAAPFAFAQTYGSPTTDSSGSSGSQTSASTQTTDPGTTGTSASSGSTTPGTPNTGAGGDAATNAVVLTLSTLVAAGGLAFLARTRKVA